MKTTELECQPIIVLCIETSHSLAIRSEQLEQENSGSSCIVHSNCVGKKPQNNTTKKLNLTDVL